MRKIGTIIIILLLTQFITVLVTNDVKAGIIERKTGTVEIHEDHYYAISYNINPDTKGELIINISEIEGGINIDVYILDSSNYALYQNGQFFNCVDFAEGVVIWQTFVCIGCLEKDVYYIVIDNTNVGTEPPWDLVDNVVTVKYDCYKLLPDATSSHYSIIDGAYSEDGYKNINYVWHYEDSTGDKYWWWQACAIQNFRYNIYRDVPVTERKKSMGYLVTTQDWAIKYHTQSVENKSIERGYGSYDEVSLTLSFVQHLQYTSDKVTTGYDEYPRFPIETLGDCGGDCEDTSILFATMVKILGYDAVLIHLPGHMGVGVKGDLQSGTYYSYKGNKYYYCETTGLGWKIGEIPDEFKDASATIIEITGEQFVPSSDGQTPGDEAETPSLPSSHTTYLDTFLPWLGILILILVLLICVGFFAHKISKSRYAPPPQYQPQQYPQHVIQQQPPPQPKSLIAQPQPAQQILPASPPPQYCTNCRREIKPEWNICIYCGKKLKDV